MGLVDIIIIVFILIGGFVGFKRGVVKQAVSAGGLFLITILSFIFKNPLSIILYENLPFFKFGGIFKGVTVLNIALYELIAFLGVFLVLMFVWRITLLASALIQRIINMSFLLGIPSKIFGFIIGIIEFYFISFIIIYVFSLPMFGIKDIIDSKNAQFILNNTPIASAFVKSNDEFFNEFTSLKDKYNNTDSANKFNYDTLDLFLKYDIINIKSVKKLVEKDKLKIDGIQELLEKYEVK